MLVKAFIENYKSIKNRMTIDFNAGKYTSLEDSNVKEGLLKGAVFVGANSSGKSNVLNSISILLDLLFADKNDLSYQVCFFNNKNMKLKYHFSIGDDFIVYDLELARDGTIKKEILKLNNEVKLNRLGTNAESFLTETRYFDELSIDSKTLFLKNIFFNTRFAGFPALAAWFKFLQNSIYVNFKRNLFMTYSPNINIDFMENCSDEDLALINGFLRETGICESLVYTNKMTVGANMLIDTGDRKQYYLKKDNCDYWMPLFMESEGNKDLIRLIPAILHLIHNDGFLFLDEFNASFHNELEELLVRYLLKCSSRSQIIIATHSTNLLKNSLIRPDQVYAVSFEGNEGTSIKKFSSEQPRTSQNLEKMYLSGVFGGLPDYV